VTTVSSFFSIVAPSPSIDKRATLSGIGATVMQRSYRSPQPNDTAKSVTARLFVCIVSANASVYLTYAVLVIPFLALTACKPFSKAAFPEAQTNAALSVIYSLSEGNVEAATTAFSNKLRTELPPETLWEYWEELLATHGPFKYIESMSVGSTDFQDGILTTVIAKCAFENDIAMISVAVKDDEIFTVLFPQRIEDILGR